MDDNIGIALLIVLLIVGLALGGVAALLGYHAWKRWRWVRTFETAHEVTPGQAAQQTRGVIRFAGVAEPGDQGELTAPVSQGPCVYWRYEVNERYRERDSKGRSRSRTSTRTVDSGASDTSFAIADEDGAVMVWPAEVEIRGIQKSRAENPLLDESSVNLGWLKLGGGGEAVQQTNEWRIPTGVRVYAMGQITYGEDGGVRLRAGEHAALVTTTPLDSFIAKQKRKGLLMALVGGAAAIVAFIVAVVMAIVV